MICSILIPSRGRLGGLKATISSILKYAQNRGDYEILVRADDDDPAMSRQTAHAIGADRLIFGPRYRGWLDNIKFYNELAALAVGKWCWIMNDDCIVSGSWLSQLEGAPDRSFVAPEVYGLGSSKYPGCADNGFPIVPMRCWEEYGWAALTHPADLALYTLLVNWNSWPVHYLKGVTCQHNRGNDNEIAAHRKL